MNVGKNVRFDDLLEQAKSAEPPQTPHKQSIEQSCLPIIKELRAKRFPVSKIAKWLEDRGVKVSAGYVRILCSKHGIKKGE